MCLQCRRSRVRKIPWRRELQPTPVFLPREFHGQRSLEGQWGHKESDTIKQLTLTPLGHYMPVILYSNYFIRELNILLYSLIKYHTPPREVKHSCLMEFLLTNVARNFFLDKHFTVDFLIYLHIDMSYYCRSY